MNKLDTLNMELNKINFNIKSFENKITQNENWGNFIEDLSLSINHNGEDIIVTKNNLSHFDNLQEIIEAKVLLLKCKKLNIENKINAITNFNFFIPEFEQGIQNKMHITQKINDVELTIYFADKIGVFLKNKNQHYIVMKKVEVDKENYVVLINKVYEALSGI